MKTTLLAGGLALTAVFAAAPAFAEMQKYKGTLSAASGVPANDSKGSGTVEATYDTATKKITYNATYKDLSGPVTAAHFHGPADEKSNAGIALGVPAGAVTSPIKGEATLTDAQAADLQGGKWYFNIHTDKNKGGEIRAQMKK